MSTWTRPNTLRKKGKVLIGGAAVLWLIAAAPAPKVVSEVKADFNGDGKVDSAAIESTANGWRLVARMAGQGAKGASVLENEPGAPDGFYVKATKPGRYGGVRVRNAAFEFGKEESGAQIIYWNGKRWSRIQQGD
jgi:hypothetical protein